MEYAQESQTNIMHQYFRIEIPERREKGPEKILEEIITRIFPNTERNTHLSQGSAEPHTDKHDKGEYAKTHINQSDKN